MGWKRNVAIVSGMSLAAAGFLAVGWVLGANDETRPADVIVSASTTSASGNPADRPPTAVSDEPPAVTGSRSPAPLPGVLPATELAALLLPRARAGDAVAACRLGLELAECRVAERWRPEEAELLSHRWGQEGSASLERLKAAEARLAWLDWQKQRKNDCEALPEDVRDLGPQLLLQAALQGNRRAMAGFASLRGVGGKELVANPALYATYRQNAFPIWRQAFESGSVDAVLVWMSALNSGGFEFFAGVLPDRYDDRLLTQAVMLEVYRELRIDPITTVVGPRIDATIDESTAREARRMFDRYFRNSPGLAIARARFMQLEQQHAERILKPLTPSDHWAQTAAGFDEGCSAFW